MHDATCPFLYATSTSGWTCYFRRKIIKGPVEKKRLRNFSETSVSFHFIERLSLTTSIVNPVNPFFLYLFLMLLFLVCLLEDLEYVSGWNWIIDETNLPSISTLFKKSIALNLFRIVSWCNGIRVALMINIMFLRKPASLPLIIFWC